MSELLYLKLMLLPQTNKHITSTYFLSLNFLLPISTRKDESKEMSYSYTESQTCLLQGDICLQNYYLAPNRWHFPSDQEMEISQISELDMGYVYSYFYMH